VIRSKATQYPDWWRGVEPAAAPMSGAEVQKKSVRYCIMNRNKRGITPT